MSRVKYPTRNAWMRKQTGMEPNPVVVRVTEVDKAYHKLCEERNYLYHLLIVESIEDFKKRFGLAL